MSKTVKLMIELPKEIYNLCVDNELLSNDDYKVTIWESIANGTIINESAEDCISRKAVQTRLKEIINEMETIFADIREREVNDSVCGLCEYDCDHGLDGFANECPGFEKDDCFKLNEKYRAEWLDISNLPSLTSQEPRWIPVSERLPEIHRDVILSLRSLDIEVGFRAETEPYFYCHGANGCYIEPQNVLAWQPLPEPYNAESEG